MAKSDSMGLRRYCYITFIFALILHKGAPRIAQLLLEAFNTSLARTNKATLRYTRSKP